MAFLYNKITQRLTLSVIILWGLISFWSSNQTPLVIALVVIISCLGIALVFIDTAPIFVLIFLSFITSFSLYNFLFQFNLPVWLIMLSILVLFGYFFYHTEQKIGILGNQRLIYLILFSLITLEVFFTLNYFLISPLSKSLIIAVICYLFIGFCYSVLARQKDSKLQTYLAIAGITILLVFISSIWGGVI